MVADVQFDDRRHAGRLLAEHVAAAGVRDPLVLGLARGGVPVGVEVAHELHAPLEVFVARKVGAPWHPEYGIGAVAEDNVRIVDREALLRLRLSDAEFDALARSEEREVEKRVTLYRAGRALPDVEERCVVLVDDGLATGVTAEAALVSLRRRRPGRLVLAVPVCASETAARLGSVADDVICAHRPEVFHAVGRWYQNFDQTSDHEVFECLAVADRAARVS